MAAMEPTHNEEWITFADDGHRVLLETIKTPMYNDEGTLIGVLDMQFIQKPFSVNDLAAKVHEVLQSERWKNAHMIS